MFKLLSGTILVAASVACSSPGNMPGTGGAGAPAGTISFPGGPTFRLVRGDPITSGYPSAAAFGDSVVVMGGQQCTITVSETVPATDPPKYKIRTVCR
jgi:hypothetical protein